MSLSVCDAIFKSRETDMSFYDCLLKLTFTKVKKLLQSTGRLIMNYQVCIKNKQPVLDKIGKLVVFI